MSTAVNRAQVERSSRIGLSRQEMAIDGENPGIEKNYRKGAPNLWLYLTAHVWGESKN